MPHSFTRADVTLANWRERPYNAWSFERVGEMVPAAQVLGDPGPALPRAPATDLLDQPFGPSRPGETIAQYLETVQTDHVLLSRNGRIRAEWHAPHADARRPHLVFSVSKSVTALLAGVLEDAGALDPARAVAHYLPDAARGAFGDATVRDLLDMRVSLDFAEDYLNRDGDYARYRRAMLWNPGPREETLSEVLYGLRKGPIPHGGPFHYQSPASDVLGFVVEHVAAQPYADFLSEAFWRPLNCDHALMTVDAAGNPRGAGGFCARGEDLMRLGQMILDGGRGLISERWLADMADNGDESAWAQGNYADWLPGGRYRSKWYALPRPSRIVMAVGIHGQWLVVDPATQTVIVRLSSQHLPQDDRFDAANLALIPRLIELAA
ncbi:MAG: serine hydrolase [Pseudooceanicola sp.]|nr:serine hydrolase [Pseudooceanicola sp.]